MMHKLIPHFIYEQYEQGNHHGRFEAVTLYLDISGFTTITQTLIQYGKEGAELLAELINQVFDPVIETIYVHGGFVTIFAGDALTVVFPQKNPAVAWQVCAVALKIGEIFAEQGQLVTLLGTFSLVSKQGIAAGEVAWGIVGSKTHKSFYFHGESIAKSVAAEGEAAAGEIVLEESLVGLLKGQDVATRPLKQGFWQLNGLDERVVVDAFERPLVADMVLPIREQFFPAGLWERPQQGEFRDVTVVFVSFEGMLRHKRLNRLMAQVMQILDSLQGHFVEIEFGDKGGLFLIYFGAPVTHENDTERALNFVEKLKDRTAVSPFVWRAGITFGTVYAGYVGSVLRDKYTCMGSVVNLAARLMMQAKWGEVLVSEPVTAPPAFDFAPIGKRHYKGFEEPVATFRLYGERASEETFPHLLVGRAEELERLQAFATMTFSQRRVGVATIYGEAGMGKSHLIHRFKQTVAKEVLWLTGQTDAVLKDAFNPFVYFLKRYFKQTADASRELDKALFQFRIDSLLAFLAERPELARLHAELQRTQSCLGALLGHRWPDSLYERLDAQGRYQNTKIALMTFLQAESQRQPVVVAFEDGHWLDSASLDLLAQISGQMAELPLLILITSRYQDDGDMPVYPTAADESNLTIELARLTPNAMLALCEDILGLPIDERLFQLLWQKSESNPFFVQQILYYLREEEILEHIPGEMGDVYGVAGTEIELPTTLNTLLIARLDRLTQEVKEVVQTAAVLGQEFELRLLAGMVEKDIESEVMIAEREQVWSFLNEFEYVFKHVLLRDAAYGMQLRARLRELHFRAAEIGERLYADALSGYYGLLAYHYEAAYLLGQEVACDQARHYLLQAGEQAMDKFEHHNATEYFGRALPLVEETQESQAVFDVRLKLEQCYDSLGDRQAQEEELKHLSALASLLGLEAQATVALRQAKYFQTISDYEMGALYAQQAIKNAFRVEDGVLLSEAHGLMGVMKWYLADLTAAQDHFQFGLDVAESDQNYFQIAYCLNGLGVIADSHGDYEAARDYYERALVSFHASGVYYADAPARFNLGSIEHLLGNWAAAREQLENALLIFRERGHRYGEASGLNNLGTLHYDLGDYDYARYYHETALNLRLEIGDRNGRGLNLEILGNVAQIQGEWEQAQSYFEEALEIFQAIGRKKEEGSCWYGLGICALGQEHGQEAKGYFERGLALHQEIGLEEGCAKGWAGLAKVSLVLEETVAAESYIKQYLAYVRENPTMGSIRNAMHSYRLAWEVAKMLGWTAEAAELVDLAGGVIQALLDKNQDLEVQEMFLAQPHHQVLWDAWQKSWAN